MAEPHSSSSDTSMPWIEKYRPTDFDNIVLDPLNRIFFRNIIDKKHFPNLLFYGPPGTGKTTTIINLINEYQTRYTRRNKETVIHLNASDERGIDIIRTQIYQFVRSRHIFESGYKFVILDEVDYMTKNAQQALKTLLQTYNSNVRFCLICNYISKIDESLQQELICVRFNQLPGEEISRFMRHIAETESFLLTDEQIDMIKETYQSDIRSMINFLQLSFMETHTLTGSTNIVPLNEWNRLHYYLEHGEETDAIRAIMELSVKHNIDTKQILLNYMNYVVKNRTESITEELLRIYEQTSHSKDDMRSYDLVCFFVSNIKPLWQTQHTEIETISAVSY